MSLRRCEGRDVVDVAAGSGGEVVDAVVVVGSGSRPFAVARGTRSS